MPYLKIKDSKKEYNLTVDINSDLSEILENNSVYLPKYCNGNGTCGKCLIKFNTVQEINDYDKRLISPEKLKEGYRLMCKAKIYKDSEIEINNNEIEIYNEKINFDEKDIFIDLGSTTICILYKDNYYSFENKQRMFGSDVLSRIKYSSDGNKKLQEIVKKDIKDIIKKIKPDKNANIYLAGNTTMEYLFLGKNPKKLGIYPFEYERLGNTFFDDYLGYNVCILPCISAFLGGDIVAGIIGLDIDKKENSLLIDLGTNGEIIINNKGKLFGTSVAAGPALEGGNMECGMASIPGAINKIHKNYKYETIGNKEATGICSSGIIDLTANLCGDKMDYTGLLDDVYFEKGFYLTDKVYITQKDIRAFQYAKSAIRTGIDILLKECSLKYTDITKIYITGGFGSKLNTDNLIKLKIIPEEFRNNIEFIHNSCLLGLKKFTEKEIYIRAYEITEKTINLNLSENSLFNDLFISNLNF